MTNGSIEEQLQTQGYYVSTTVGWSMFPMLRNRRDRVIIRPVGAERLKKYDLPLYHRPDGKYVLHRVIGVKPDHYVIRGDNTYVKEHIPDAWIVGYVTEFYRGGHHVSADARRYRFYAGVWNFLFPARWLFVHCRRFAARVWRKLFPKKKSTEQPGQS